MSIANGASTRRATIPRLPYERGEPYDFSRLFEGRCVRPQASALLARAEHGWARPFAGLSSRSVVRRRDALCWW